MTTGADVVAEARRWLGTPFQHQAYLHGVGCDCIGLIIGVALALRLADGRPEARDPAFNGYGKSPNPALLLRACDHYLLPIETPEPGDILLMRFTSQPQHFAIVSSVAPTYLIHAYERAGAVVEHVMDRTWHRRVLRAFRFRELALCPA